MRKMLCVNFFLLDGVYRRFRNKDRFGTIFLYRSTKIKSIDGFLNLHLISIFLQCKRIRVSDLL